MNWCRVAPTDCPALQKLQSGEIVAIDDLFDFIVVKGDKVGYPSYAQPFGVGGAERSRLQSLNDEQLVREAREQHPQLRRLIEDLVRIARVDRHSVSEAQQAAMLRSVLTHVEEE